MSTTTEQLRAQFPDLVWTKLPSPEDHPKYTYYGFDSTKSVLKKGHTRFPGRLALPTDVIYDRDVAIPLRDEVKIYADIFRPVNTDAGEKVPAIIPWSPYGKTGTGVMQYENMAPFRVGIRENQTSGYEKFEGPDPADWIHRGYAIINVDARSIGSSGGDAVFWGQQEAEDIYDTIDWISKQPWCTGAVGMCGNSWLAISQVNFASRLEHPALKALAPWEGRTDVYRDTLARGGRRHNPSLHQFLMAGFAGPNLVENMPVMLNKRPFFDEYWAEKYIHTENINVPLYITGSYSSQLHSRSSFHTFRTAKTTQKWFRVHPFHEWYDLYRPESVNDLQRYFDYFLKNIENGWTKDTPKVRISLLGFESGGSIARTISERPENEYPLAREVLKTFFLDATTKKMQVSAISDVSFASHVSNDNKSASEFTLAFEKYTEIAGYPKVRLWVSCKDHDDLDIAVHIRKVSKHGKLLDHLNYPCPVPIEEVPSFNTSKCLGPQGFLRASHAITKVEGLSTDQEIFYQHDRRKPIEPGTITKVEITLWPIGMVFEAGEGIMLRIAGHDMIYPETDKIIQSPLEDNENVGVHNVHTGGSYDSALILPFV